VELAAQKETI